MKNIDDFSDNIVLYKKFNNHFRNKQYFVGREILKTLTNEKILLSSNGKPYIKSNSIYFNISHSNNYVVCAYGKKRVGIDIEFIKDINIVNYYKIFTELERKQVIDIESFYTIYTLKEAYIKLYDLNISNLIELEVTIRNGNININKDLTFFTKKVDNYIISILEEK